MHVQIILDGYQAYTISFGLGGEAMKTPHQRSMISCLKEENFRRALDAAAIHVLLREGMHVKEIDMGSSCQRGPDQMFQLAT